MIEDSSPIGILADSHGQVSLLETAIKILKDSGCYTIVHLGDICDSASMHTAKDSVDLIQYHNIIAVKGNNDHSVCVSGNPLISKSTQLFLKELPLVVQIQNIVFSHSLPFEKELGLSCMIQNLNEFNIQLLINHCASYTVLFRGHSHQPELIQSKNGDYERTQLKYPLDFELMRDKKYIVTCGAVLNSQCAIFYPKTMMFCGIIFNRI